jgi:hypothetical protein
VLANLLALYAYTVREDTGMLYIYPFLGAVLVIAAGIQLLLGGGREVRIPPLLIVLMAATLLVCSLPLFLALGYSGDRIDRLGAVAASLVAFAQVILLALTLTRRNTAA